MSRHTPIVFNVAKDFYGAVLEQLSKAGLPEVTSVSLFSNTYRSTALLDGLVIELDNYSINIGGLKSGLRVVGFKPTRLLTHLLNLDAPKRRLKGEDTVPSVDELLQELETQRQLPKSELEERAKAGFGVADRVSLLLLVRQLFGDRYLPPLDAALKRETPAPGPWGEAGFNMYEAEYLESISMPLDEAKRWRGLLDWDDVRRFSGVQLLARLRPYGLERLRPWLQAGFQPSSATALIDLGRTLDDVKPFLDVGCHPALILDFIKGNLGPDAYTEYKEAGVHPQWFAAAGLRASDAIAWERAGFYSGLAAMLTEAGVTLEEAKKLKQQGLTNEQIRAHAAKL